MAAFEDIQCRRSVVSDTLQLLTDQANQWRDKIDLLEAGQHLDRSEALTSFGQLLDVCQNLRYAILSEDCTANWKTKEELHGIVQRIDSASVKRRRYLDLAEALGAGSVTHRRERTRQERLKQRDAAVAELMEISALASPPDLPGPKIDEWLNWACNLDDSSNSGDLEQLQKFFPRLDDFVRQLEIELWHSTPEQNENGKSEKATSDLPEALPAISITETSGVGEQPSSGEETATGSALALTATAVIEAEVTEDPAAAEEPTVAEEPAAETEVSPVFSALEPVVAPSIEGEAAEAAEENWSATTESGKLSFFAADEVEKFERVVAEGKDSRRVRGLLAISHWLTPPDQNPVLHAGCGMRTLIGYTGSSDLLAVTPDQAQEAIASDNGVLLFTGGADLLRWGIAQRCDERVAGIASVRRLSKNQLKAWFKDLHKIELAEPQVQDMHNLTHGVPLLVGELHRLVIPDPKTPPTWLGFMIWTTVKANFDRRLPVVARELRNGSAGVRLTEREIRVLKMVAIASENSTSKTIASNLQEGWDQYRHPELEALSSGDEDSVALLQGLGLLPMRRDFGLTAIQSMLPMGPGDPVRQIVSYL